MYYLNKKKIKNFRIYNYLLVTILLFIGIIISSYKGYGDDIDARTLVGVYINIVENGLYAASRYHGYPLAEIIYGFLAYNYGSFVSVFFSYIIFLLAIFFLGSIFTISYEKKILLLLLTLSNPVLFLDNTNPSDAVLALFFFSAGMYLLTKKNIYASIFFAFCIASRPNYALLIYVPILYMFTISEYKKKFLINVLVFTSLIGGLFYLPVAINFNLSLRFLPNVGGPELTFISLVSRFIYKIYLSIGSFSSLLLIASFIIFYKKVNISIFKKNTICKVFIFIISLNLITFLMIPSKTSIISLVIVLFYIFLIIAKANNKLLIFIVITNSFFYLFSLNLINIKYRYNDACKPIQAIDAKFKLSFGEGHFLNRHGKLKKKIYCDSLFFKSREEQYRKGEKMRLIVPGTIR